MTQPLPDPGPDLAGAVVHVVDDDPDLGAAIARMLARQGFATRAFCDPVDLLDQYAAMPAHAVVSDVMMGDLDGFGFADRLLVSKRDLVDDAAFEALSQRLSIVAKGRGGPQQRIDDHGTPTA